MKGALFRTQELTEHFHENSSWSSCVGHFRGGGKDHIIHNNRVLWVLVKSCGPIRQSDGTNVLYTLSIYYTILASFV